MKSIHFLAPLVLFISLAFCSVAQTTTISGSVNDSNGDPLIGANILVKGKVLGTTTNVRGEFSLTVNQAPPLVLVVSYVGYQSQEIEISQAQTDKLSVTLQEETLYGQEVVVSASRFEESILESPVSIEKMDIIDIQKTPADNYYKGLAYLKGVDVTTSSINFQIINTRGFGSTGNTRFVQLVDGMDTQAPALNFPIGNLNGPSELDIESIEMIPGASSALYGPNAFNGMLLINSKNAFEYQGLSAFAKLGVNHIGDKADYDGPSPVYDVAIRYAKAFNNKFAFKVNFAYMQAQDWHGTDATDRQISRTPQDFSFNPGSDRLHYMGDEASTSLAILRLNPAWVTVAQATEFAPGVTAWDYAQNGWLPSTVVSVTPYKEKDLADYNAKNLKANVGLYYRINDKAELSYLYNGGFGTSIYTGAQRYSLKNFGIQQHRVQLRGDNYYIRAYTTLENSGDSYINEFLAKRLNDIRSGGDVGNWLGAYATYYLGFLYGAGFTDPTNNVSVPVAVQEAAHQFARGQTDNIFSLVPGTPAFENAKAVALQGVVPEGPKFQDKSGLYHIMGHYDLKNQIDFMELAVGGSYRLFDLNSDGTIFDDLNQDLSIKEYGAYVQAGKWLGDRRLKLSASLRYDKNENFDGQFNPRISGLLKVSENHNFRVSYQTGFRNPDTQGQHIDLNTITARLLGGLPQYKEKYNLFRTSSTGVPLTYEAYSVQAYKTAVFSQGATVGAIFDPANYGLLVPVTSLPTVKPEQVQTFELGYKSLIANKLFIDLSYYYNTYNDFISQVQLVIAEDLGNGTPNFGTLLNSQALVIESGGTISGNTAQIYTNVDQTIHTQGIAIGASYNLPRGYTVTGNYNWNVIQNVPEGFLSEFNTPENKFNLGIGNRKLTDHLGFDVNYRWQDRFRWESSFVIPRNGFVPAYSTLDAQVSYKLPSFKSILKLGGSNILNERYIQSLGGPNIGALYYISITFDELMN